MDDISKKMLLHVGDMVALAAPARWVRPDELAPAVSLLESWGLKVLLPDGLFNRCNQFAGNDAHRAALFQQLFDSPEIRAIFCVRGGYGTVRIIDKLDLCPLSAYPKWIVGYSDITVLHSHLAKNMTLPTLHATMPINITDIESSDATESLRQWLFNGCLDYRFDAPSPSQSEPTNRTGRCHAPVVGGNLSVLYSLLGSSSDIDTEGKILLIEDLDEYLYHIDRMMTALKRAGKLDRLKGLIVGSLTDMHDNAIPFGRNAEQIVSDAVSDYDYPVAYHCPFGHIGTKNRALPLGVECHLEVSNDKTEIHL